MIRQYGSNSVLALGDSLTAGTGVAPEEAGHALLSETILHELHALGYVQQ